MSTFVSVVTGAAGALGSEVVRTLVAAGQRVLAVDRPEASTKLGELARAFPEGSCLSEAFDVIDAESWAKFLGRARTAQGTPRGAVLIAGGWQGGLPFHAQGADAIYRAMFESNLETARRSLQAILPGMLAQRSGSIVVIGSRAVERPWESANAAAYASAKAALVTLAQAVSAEVLDQGVRVNAVLPSTIDTPANRAAMPSSDSSRWVSTSSLAGIIRFLLGDEARDISGAAIPVYGRA